MIGASVLCVKEGTYLKALDMFFEVFLAMEDLLRFFEARGHTVKVIFKGFHFFYDFVVRFRKLKPFDNHF